MCVTLFLLLFPQEISKEQSDAIAEAVSQGPAESLESIVLKYEHLIQQPATPAVLGVESSNDIDGDSKLGNEGDEVREKQAEGSHKRNRSSERSSSRNRSYPGETFPGLNNVKI